MSEEIKEKIKAYYIANDIDKILNYITDLQQKVEQLEKENKELRDENKRIFQNVNDDELLISNAMNYAELKKAEKKVEQLENIRKKAIDLINKNSQYPTYYLTGNIVKDLLNILNKGDNNVKNKR